MYDTCRKTYQRFGLGGRLSPHVLLNLRQRFLNLRHDCVVLACGGVNPVNDIEGVETGFMLE